ncbi:MAG: 3-dehydroquinate synthase [Cyclobacteriaceae bacterium]|nr:3-dehydroquinate synthase [Cyclobacteriaceae bacterium]
MPIDLPDYIEITKNVKNHLASFLKENTYSSVFVLVDDNTQKYCLPIFENGLDKTTLISIKYGEQNKTLETCAHIWQVLTDESADRNALLINLGGGVIGDMGGFCASTYKRGIDFVNIPTTLLSQVDASVGGKLGIDFNGFKNHIGLFKLPVKVIIDPVFLVTLPLDQLRSGFSEMLKHGFIQDKEHLQTLAKLDISNTNWLAFITQSVKIKSKIVSADPLEKNERKFLNFGHTVGHAVETYFLNNGIPILHGEAVAIGMIAEAHLSERHTGFSTEDKNRLIHIVDSYFERKEIPENGMKEILNNLEQDKKNTDSKIQAALLREIGLAKHSVELTKKEVEEALEFYNAK